MPDDLSREAIPRVSGGLGRHLAILAQPPLSGERSLNVTMPSAGRLPQQKFPMEHARERIIAIPRLSHTDHKFAHDLSVSGTLEKLGRRLVNSDLDAGFGLHAASSCQM
jgi:hypothetical protein